ncbi:MAG: G5 domain-containing protein [Oscillospiraceae bacterium]|nr:G5 domain-containing protein [Oscillospiraceae bacterium]
MPLGNFFRKKKDKQSKRTSLNPPIAETAAELTPAAQLPAPQHSFQAETEALLTLFMEDDDAAEPQETAAVAAQAAAWAAQLGRETRSQRAETEALLTLLFEDGEDDLPAAEPQQETAKADETAAPQAAEVPSAAEEAAEEPAAQTAEAPAPVRTIYKASAQETAAKSRLTASVNRLYGYDRSEEEREKERRHVQKAIAIGRAVRSAFAVLLLAAVGCVFAAYRMGWRVNRIYDADAEPVLYLSDESATKTILSEAGITLRLGDETAAEENGPIRCIYITRAFPVTVTADGQQHVLHITEAVDTVEEVLQMAGVSVGSDDLMSHTLYEKPYNEMNVIIQRVTYKEITVTETIPSEPRVKESPLLKAGKTLELLTDTKADGVKELVCRETYIDGVLSATDVLSETVLREPMQSILLTGANVPASPINGAKYTSTPILNNAPLEYTQLIEDGVCTAYSYKPGVWGASGMYLYQGMVAVDPDKIPLGSLLYITSADGSFVYGWAIAADVCEAAVWGRVTVDCFFETYRESQLFGRHEMNIYVVDQLTQADLAEFVAKEGYFIKRIPE